MLEELKAQWLMTGLRKELEEDWRKKIQEQIRELKEGMERSRTVQVEEMKIDDNAVGHATFVMPADPPDGLTFQASYPTISNSTTKSAADNLGFEIRNRKLLLIMVVDLLLINFIITPLSIVKNSMLFPD